MKLLSIVTINLNNRSGLKNSIESVKAQNVKDSLEYIVIDGLSSDGSQKLIEENTDCINLFLIEKDRGIFDAMNKAIGLATGKYIYFLNSGDVFADECVLSEVIRQIEATKEEPNIIVGLVDTYISGEYIGKSQTEPWVAHQAAFVKNSVMKEYRFDSEFKIFGDLDLWTRLKKNGEFEFQRIDTLVARMEMDGLGSSPIYMGKRIQDYLRYAKKHRAYSNLIKMIALSLMGWPVYKIFGEKIYLKTFCRGIQNLKALFNRLFNNHR